MAPLWLLGAAAALLGATGPALPPSGAAGPPSHGSSLHSLKMFYTTLSEPEIGAPQFIVAGYVDDQLIELYDSSERKFLPKVQWMEEAVKNVSQYWDTYSTFLKKAEAVFLENLVSLRNHYNQTGGFHTLQYMYGCELRKDGSKGGYRQYAYDGRDCISFDKETLTWTAADGPAQISKRKFDAETANNQYRKAYLEETCIAWLQKCLDFGKEMLLRTERPVGKVTCKAVGNGQETLVCQAYGFYPKEIEATWKKGEEIMEHDTFRRSVAPNSDGTYHTWLSIEIDPKDRDLYWCHVDHASMPTPLVLAFEGPPDVNVGLLVGAILGVVAVLLLAGLAIFFLRNRQKKADYKAATTSEKSSDSSARA